MIKSLIVISPDEKLLHVYQVSRMIGFVFHYLHRNISDRVEEKALTPSHK